MKRLSSLLFASLLSTALVGCGFGSASDKATIDGHVSVQACPGLDYPRNFVQRPDLRRICLFTSFPQGETKR